MLCCESLSVELDQRPVLHQLSLQLPGGWTALVGPNGAGKSTLLRALAGLIEPQSGSVSWAGQALRLQSPSQRARLLAWLPQQDSLSGDLTVREADDLAVEAAMHRTDCLAWQNRSMQRLSGGERQRVHLARALATGASVLLLDEPTTHLDPPHQWALASLFRELAATHTVVTVLHDLTLALQADTVVALEQGRLQVHAPHDSPRLHQGLETLFAPAVHIQPRPDGTGRFSAVPAPLQPRAEQPSCPTNPMATR